MSLPPVYLNLRNKLFIEKATTLWDTYSNGPGTMEGFTQLLSEMDGKKMSHGGLRGESQRINGDPVVREICALLEDLLIGTAQNVFEKTLIRVQANSERGDFKSAIGELLEMRGNEDFLDSLGIEKALELDEHLASLRGRLSVQGSATSPHFSPGENPELFGLDPQEVALLTELSRPETDVSGMGFCREAVALLRKKLGRFAPAGLEWVESQSDPRDLSTNDDVVRLMGFRIFLSESLQKGQGQKLWLDHSREILKKITESLKRCDVDQFERKREQINPMASGRSLKGNLRGVQREYIQDHSLRIYFRIFNDGNIALIEVDNKGSSTTKGAMNPELTNRLLPFAGASSFYNPLYKGFRPLLSRGKDSLVAGGEKPKGLPASIADRLARNQWREEERKYYVYTKYMAPAWEWIYFVPGLNLVGQ
ncbi:MAG: hypothetical protein IPN90_09315 [Elusimicrobia bacterium]|nr:hypothetical protein [Elusimicrobiota bacterium]